VGCSPYRRVDILRQHFVSCNAHLDEIKVPDYSAEQIVKVMRNSSR